YGANAAVLETGRRDALGQGFGQADMALRDDGADALFDHMIIDDIFQHVLGVGDVVGGQVHIDAYRLGSALFLAIDTNMGRQFQVADEDVANAAGGAGEIGWLAHSPTVTSGVCQIRCWPPSTASIWPVTASADSR